MTEDTDPFGDLDDTLGDGADGADDSGTETQDGTTNEPTTDSPTTSQMQTDQPTTTDADGQDRPAFPFDDAKQDSLYARKEAWREFEDALDFEVKRELRERGHENIEGRELHDAALRVVSDYHEEIADEVERQRKI